MKKIMILALSVVTLASCNQFGGKSNEFSDEDSLTQILNQKETELKKVLETTDDPEVQYQFAQCYYTKEDFTAGFW